MEENKKKALEEKLSQEDQTERKPYEKPQVLYRAPLEAMAAACLPINPGKSGGGCTTLFS